MNSKDDVEGWWLLGLGVLVLAVGLGLVGKLFWILYDTSVYFVVGFVVAAFIVILAGILEAHKERGLAIQRMIAEMLSEFRGQMSHIEEHMRRTTKSFEVLKTYLDEQSKLCEKVIENTEALLNPKPPVVIPIPEPTPPEVEQIQDAIEEVVGGAL